MNQTRYHVEKGKTVARTLFDDFKYVAYMINHEHMYIACLPPKASSSNWIRYIRYSEGIRNAKSAIIKDGNKPGLHDHVDEPDIGLHFLTEETAYTYLSDPSYFKFAVVRHPVDRLLSIFSDTFKQECDNRRLGNFPARGNICTVDSSELNDSTRNLTFGGFVRSLFQIDEYSLNEHIRPLFDLCMLGRVAFDFIGDLRVSDDMGYISRRLGFNETFTQNVNKHVTNGSCLSCKRGSHSFSTESCAAQEYDEYFRGNKHVASLNANEIFMLNHFTRSDVLSLGYNFVSSSNH